MREAGGDTEWFAFRTQKGTSAKYGIAFAMGLLLLQVTATNAQTNSRKPDPLQGLDEYITQGMRDCKLPRFSIAIVKDHSIVLYRKDTAFASMARPHR